MWMYHIFVCLFTGDGLWGCFWSGAIFTSSCSVVKESACTTEDLGSIPRSGRYPGKGNCNPLQYSCLKSSMDRVHGITKSQTQLCNWLSNFQLKDSHEFLCGYVWSFLLCFGWGFFGGYMLLVLLGSYLEVIQ